MYKCKECGRVFDKPYTYGEDRTPYGGIGEIGFTEYYLGCPECSGDYVEVTECEVCHKYFEPCPYEDDNSVCEDCYEED